MRYLTARHVQDPVRTAFRGSTMHGVYYFAPRVARAPCRRARRYARLLCQRSSNRLETNSVYLDDFPSPSPAGGDPDAPLGDVQL
jgi:hypothetical protein